MEVIVWFGFLDLVHYTNGFQLIKSFLPVLMWSWYSTEFCLLTYYLNFLLY